MEVWHVLFPCYVQCVHAFVARSAQLFDLTISTTKSMNKNSKSADAIACINIIP